MPDNGEWAKSIENATTEVINKQVKKMQKACLLVENEAKVQCSADMGTLRASIHSEVEVTPESIVGRIGSQLEYAPYVHQGTGIYAKEGNGRKTPWKWFGKIGKYKGWHTTQGQKPQPFLQKAVTLSRSKIQNILKG
ncbi:HK97 gp10 family phage protein [Blautia hansenii]|uniref:HK97 gp10 family phage protein n=1 Tax=Blautia hansenii TaxID=1322 RepID=UPI003983EFB4